MNSQYSIVFDADDTLWDEQKMLQGFEQAVEEILDVELGYASNFSKVFIDLENDNIPHIGYGFPSYMFSVGEAIASNSAWYPHKDKLLEKIRSVITQFTLGGPELIESVPETLKKLQDEGFTLFVVTRGVEFEQKFKLEKSGIKHFFKDIAIVQKKDKQIYEKAARQFEMNPRHLCMVGNSIRADVNPAIQAGWRAINVPAPTAWAHDDAEIINSPRAHIVKSFSEIYSSVIESSFWAT